MADFVPTSDPDFDTLFSAIALLAADPANPLKLTPEVIAQVAAASAAWTPAWADWQAEQPAWNAKLQAKNAGRSLAETALRAVNAAVQANPVITDAQRASAGLPVYKTTRTPVGDIESRPIIITLDNEHLLHRIWFVDEVTAPSKAKPAGVAFCEIREAIVPPGGAAPTDPEKMTFVVNDTKTPYRNDFTADQVGSRVYYALRWVNTAGKPGPWSEVIGYPIT